MFFVVKHDICSEDVQLKVTEKEKRILRIGFYMLDATVDRSAMSIL